MSSTFFYSVSVFCICFHFVGDFFAPFNPDLAKIHHERLMIVQCSAMGVKVQKEDEERKSDPKNASGSVGAQCAHSATRLKTASQKKKERQCVCMALMATHYAVPYAQTDGHCKSENVIGLFVCAFVCSAEASLGLAFHQCLPN